MKSERGEGQPGRIKPLNEPRLKLRGLPIIVTMKIKGPASPIRQARLAVGISAERLGREAGFSVSKTLRLERDLGRARFADVAVLAESLRRLAQEQARGQRP